MCVTDNPAVADDQCVVDHRSHGPTEMVVVAGVTVRCRQVHRRQFQQALLASLFEPGQLRVGHLKQLVRQFIAGQRRGKPCRGQAPGLLPGSSRPGRGNGLQKATSRCSLHAEPLSVTSRRNHSTPLAAPSWRCPLIARRGASPDSGVSRLAVTGGRSRQQNSRGRNGQGLSGRLPQVAHPDLELPRFIDLAADRSKPGRTHVRGGTAETHSVERVEHGHIHFGRLVLLGLEQLRQNEVLIQEERLAQVRQRSGPGSRKWARLMRSVRSSKASGLI